LSETGKVADLTVRLGGSRVFVLIQLGARMPLNGAQHTQWRES